MYIQEKDQVLTKGDVAVFSKHGHKEEDIKQLRLQRTRKTPMLNSNNKKSLFRDKNVYCSP
jgi:hypothetical protein